MLQLEKKANVLGKECQHKRFKKETIISGKKKRKRLVGRRGRKDEE